AASLDPRLSSCLCRCPIFRQGSMVQQASSAARLLRFPSFPLLLTRERKLFRTKSDTGTANSARFVQTARFAFSTLTRSLAHVCGGIAQSRANFKVGSNPVRVALVDAGDRRRVVRAGRNAGGFEARGG